MTVNKRKKDTKFRGSHTHGWGSKKKHRGAGNRGGKGMAGTGKRADQKKPSIWKEEYFGKHGFSRINAKDNKCVNVGFLDQNIEKIAKAGQAKQQDSSFAINISDLGFDKLLGSGKIKRKMIITADYASIGAIEAVKAAGGEVTVKKQPSK
jgi:large subunit ribosomal protein L15